jgi:hypothetical protein
MLVSRRVAFLVDAFSKGDVLADDLLVLKFDVFCRGNACTVELFGRCVRFMPDALWRASPFLLGDF